MNFYKHMKLSICHYSSFVHNRSRQDLLLSFKRNTLIWRITFLLVNSKNAVLWYKKPLAQHWIFKHLIIQEEKMKKYTALNNTNSIFFRYIPEKHQWNIFHYNWTEISRCEHTNIEIKPHAQVGLILLVSTSSYKKEVSL